MSETYIQNNFSHGELDPRMFAQVDLDAYYKTARRLRNVYVRPQGGVVKRHGTIYQDTIQANIDEYHLASFVLIGDIEYLLVFRELNLDIYSKDSATGVLSKQVTIVTPITTDQLPNLQTAQNGNFMVITNETLEPQQLVNNGTASDWTLQAINFKNYPAYDFEKNYYDDTFTLASTSIGKNIRLTWTTGSFTSDYEGGLFISLGNALTSPIGAARIVTFVSATEVDVDIVSAFDASLSSGGASGNHCFLGEPAFSTDHGYPIACTFYEDRLCFGATSKLPQTLFISKVGDFPNFDQGQGLDDEGFVYTLAADNFNKIEYVISDKSLQIFCNDAEFSSMQYFAEPLTPSSASFRKQSGYGSVQVEPVIIDNQTFYARKGGKSIMSFVYDANSTSYQSVNASIYSAILIDNPVSMAVLEGDGVDDADYMFVVNKNGELLTFQTFSQERISAWTVSVTGPDMTDLTPQKLVPSKGKYREVIAIKDRVYAIIERTIPSGTFQYLEMLSFDVKTDSSLDVTYASPKTTISNLNHLIGETVKIIADGVLLNDQVVNENGEITLDTPASNIKAGLPYSVLLETIPAYLAQSGRLYVPKRIVRAWIDYFETIGIFVEDAEVPDLKFGPHVLDEPIEPLTGVYEHLGEGWAIRPTISITQTEPLPFLIIGIGYEVS